MKKGLYLVPVSAFSVYINHKSWLYMTKAAGWLYTW
jgi:hypothetical protein